MCLKAFGFFVLSYAEMCISATVEAAKNGNKVGDLTSVISQRKIFNTANFKNHRILVIQYQPKQCVVHSLKK